MSQTVSAHDAQIIKDRLLQRIAETDATELAIRAQERASLTTYIHQIVSGIASALGYTVGYISGFLSALVEDVVDGIIAGFKVGWDRGRGR